MTARSRADARRVRAGRRHAVQALVAVAIVGAVAAAATGNSAPAARKPGVWVAAWSTSPQGLFPLQRPGAGTTRMVPTRLTVREIVHPSVGGAVVRVGVTNFYGVTPLVVEAGTVAVAGSAGSVVSGTLRPVTFSGRRAVTLAPEASAD